MKPLGGKEILEWDACSHPKPKHTFSLPRGHHNRLSIHCNTKDSSGELSSSKTLKIPKMVQNKAALSLSHIKKDPQQGKGKHTIIFAFQNIS